VLIIPIILVIVVFVIYFLAAQSFQEIAEMKGHTDKKYFWWCFWTGAAGWLMVVALPDRSNGSNGSTAPTNENTSSDELPDL
jgi:hypothetical protein